MLANTVLLITLMQHVKHALASRALSQWRTSWLSREGVAALATYVPALVFGLLAFVQLLDVHDGVYSIPLDFFSVALCIVLAGLAAITVVCTAMI